MEWQPIEEIFLYEPDLITGPLRVVVSGPRFKYNLGWMQLGAKDPATGKPSVKVSADGWGFSVDISDFVVLVEPTCQA